MGMDEGAHLVSGLRGQQRRSIAGAFEVLPVRVTPKRRGEPNIPLVGFLPGDDERVTGTIDAISRELGRDGFVSRYSTAETDDGLPGDEGQFLACSFWLVSALALNGRIEEARALFERLLGLSNDLGLLSEEYDVPRSRQVGNFPQAFSHLTLIVAARAIAGAEEAARSD